MNPNELGSVDPKVTTGSPAGSADAGKPAIDPEQFKNLEQLVGKQGQELGEYRQFFADVAPLLEKLDKNPELVQAIIDGKIDANLAKAAMDGKITINDAQAVTKANEDVKKALGSRAYNAASQEDIAKLIEEKVAAAKDEFKSNLKEIEETRSFEAQVNEFIAKTPDFADYAKEIDKWLDAHDITDIEVAYYAVKGQLSEREAKKRAEEAQGEYAKDVALNAGGGNSRVTYSGEGAANIADSLIAGRSNPNVF